MTDSALTDEEIFGNEMDELVPHGAEEYTELIEKFRYIKIISRYLIELPNGIELQIRPVSTQRINAAFDKAKEQYLTRYPDALLEPPTYELETDVALPPGVDAPRAVYNLVSIRDAPEEDKIKWREFVTHSNNVTNIAIANMLQTLVLRGTVYKIPDNGWVAEHEYDGIKVPENPRDKYIHYMINEVLVPPAAAQEFAFYCMRISMAGLPEEVVTRFESSFPNPLSTRKRPNPSTNQEEIKEG